jgi:glutamate-1-semialdehyde 2,1-aminomutase
MALARIERSGVTPNNSCAPPRNYREVAAADRRGYAQFALALLHRGVRVLERGAWFVSSEHDDSVIDATLAAVRDAAGEVAPGLAGTR